MVSAAEAHLDFEPSSVRSAFCCVAKCLDLVASPLQKPFYRTADRLEQSSTTVDVLQALQILASELNTETCQSSQADSTDVQRADSASNSVAESRCQISSNSRIKPNDGLDNQGEEVEQIPPGGQDQGGTITSESLIGHNYHQQRATRNSPNETSPVHDAATRSRRSHSELRHKKRSDRNAELQDDVEFDHCDAREVRNASTARQPRFASSTKPGRPKKFCSDIPQSIIWLSS
ncbi:hypothetical protein EJ05DRAFT_297159 [Pseudovirgaria hyperparasitica]|uniref:Uncharacterized protein n=1 Tax=Pseudovirgaria hyperparasitica TaxID=470096 RepID=A0A6A6VTF4_9PEZI|nr:uncharacterized protein EJ05DRAFT_297159 [Pseudovirgaria hyperparasitica]KAF2752517.1 hypothetical protein EJ05DRAFT_297159 [Pseudovirgaria hyperparasitica]